MQRVPILRLVDNAAPSAPKLTLADLAERSRWVAWRVEQGRRADGSKFATKIPYDPHNASRARVPTDPSSWGTRAEAERRWRQISKHNPNAVGGVGFVLGQLPDAQYLVGIDLDSCRDPDSGAIADWAQEIITRFRTYAEVSPSTTGVKLFFLLSADDFEKLRGLLGCNADGSVKTRKVFAAGKHQEVAVDTARFYAVTDQRLEQSPDELRLAPLLDVEWLLKEAGPAYLARYRPGKVASIRDESRSGYGWRFMRRCKRAGDTYERALAAILADPGRAGDWAREKTQEGAKGQRQLRRPWDRIETGASTPEARPLTTRAISTFVGQEVNWLWEPFFPRQMLTVVFGDSDVGKSTVLNDLAARLTTGRTLPRFGNDPVQRLDKGSVVILCKEDSIELMVRPRLEAAGADLEKVHVVGYPPAPGDDYFQQLERLDTTVEALQEQIRKIGDVRLLIIDPITDYVGEIDTYRDEQVRRLLDPLNGLARRFDLAIVYVLHLNKKEDMSARYRMLAGVGFRNAPRSAILVAADREHEGRGLMLQDKKNLRPKKVMVAFRFNTVAGQPCIEWEPDWQEVVEADELLRSKTASKQSKAAELLRKWLAEGPRPAREVMQLAKDNNISVPTLHLVKPLIGVVSAKRDDGRWFWSLPRGR